MFATSHSAKPVGPFALSSSHALLPPAMRNEILALAGSLFRSVKNGPHATLVFASIRLCETLLVNVG